MLRAIVIGLALTSVVFGSPVTAKAPDTWDGLHKVKAKRLDALYLLPGADFRSYTKVIIDPTEITMRKNWQKDVNRQMRTRINDKELAQALALARSYFEDQLRIAYQKAGYEITSEAGPEVLRIGTIIINVNVEVPDNNSATRSRTYSTEAGEATLAIEVRDSMTASLMGRAVDQRTAGDWGPYLRNTITNRADFEKLFATWAKISADGLNALKELSPIDTNARLKR